MPRGDRTGPAGMGPMTGRGMGYCAGYDRPGYMNPGFGRGAGYGYGLGYRGGGFGWRHRYYATGVPGWGRWGGYPYPPAPAPVQPSREEEAAGLRQQAEDLQAALDDVKRRLDELSGAEE